MHRSKLVLAFVAALAFALAAGQSYAATLTTLYSFDVTHGQFPEGNLTIIGSTLYGMTLLGGATDDGTIFRVPVTGGTPTVLTSFDDNHGGNPQGDLTLSADGSKFYGMTEAGAVNTQGTIFSAPVTGGATTVLSYFNGTNGGDIRGDVTLSADGSTLYGMTASGGANNYGTIFSDPVTGGPPTVLFSFDGTHGEYGYGSLTLSGSTLYGMTEYGGAQGDGTIFSIPVTGGIPTVLYSFDGTQHGGIPYGSLILSGATLYGETQGGGAGGHGTVFSFPTTGGTPNVLASFNGTNGDVPQHSLTLGGSTLYGMTIGGGAHNDGTIFSVPVTGGNPTDLYSFDGTHGLNPHGSLTLSGSTLYGMTYQGGANGDGTIFALALPEPSSVVLLGFGAIGLGVMALRRRMREQAASTRIGVEVARPPESRPSLNYAARQQVLAMPPA